MSRLRFAELLGSLSMVADLGYSLPPGEAMRSCLLATALARRLRLSESEVAQTFYTALLRHVGCLGFAHELHEALGDDLQANAAGGRTNFADAKDVFTTMIPAATSGLPPLERARIAGTIATRGPLIGRRYETASCEVASIIARRVGLSGGIQRSLQEVFEWWNGRGNPRGLKRDDIAPSARVARVAGDAVHFGDLGGSALAVDALRRRAGKITDPEIVEVFTTNAAAYLEDCATGDPRLRMLEEEPRPVVEVDRSRLAVVAEAFADLADLKAPFMHGHSRGVARLARAAAPGVGLDEASADELYVAGLLHDLGRASVSNRIWEKAVPLASVEWEQVRMYPYHSERILATSQTLEPFARIVGMQRERLDGSGYYRGCRSREIPTSARVLACADAFVAMTAPRPYRDALPAEQAADALRFEAGAGWLDPDVTRAVLAAAGQQVGSASAKARPSGLTEREVEVLRLVAEGCSNREIAGRLHIARRTAEHHVQHVYTKIGVSSRAAAALFAVEHGLLPPRT